MYLRLSLAALLLATAACSGATSDAEAPASEGAVRRTDDTVQKDVTKSIKGSFQISLEGKKPKFEFTISKINWDTNKAVWSAKVIDDDGLPEGKVSNDKNIAMTIATARCGCTYTFGNTEKKLSVFVSEGKVESITYFGHEAKILDTKPASADAPAEADEEEAKAGICEIVLTCMGDESYATNCAPVDSKAKCVAGLFDDRPRCPHIYRFTAGKTCSR